MLASFISSFSWDLRAFQSEEGGEDEVAVGNFCLLHLLRLNSRRVRAHCTSFLLGWSDPRFTLATEPCAKVGSLQPTPVFCPCPKSTDEGNASSVLPSSPFSEEVNRMLNHRVNRVFQAPFTIPRQKRPLNLNRIFAPLPLQRPQKQNM